MKSCTTLEISEGMEKDFMYKEPDCKFWGKSWVEDTKEVREAVAFLRHLKKHEEVKNNPICKICGMTSKQILLKLDIINNDF